jgi:hypothetical protein
MQQPLTKGHLSGGPSICPPSTRIKEEETTVTSREKVREVAVSTLTSNRCPASGKGIRVAGWREVFQSPDPEGRSLLPLAR